MSNYTLLSHARQAKRDRLENLAAPYKSFDSIETMDLHLLAFVKFYGSQMSDSSIMLLEHLSRYSLHVFGVSWLSVRSMANLIGVSERTVQRILSNLESMGIIHRIDTSNTYGGRGVNLIVIQPVSEEILSALTVEADDPTDPPDVTGDAASVVTTDGATEALKALESKENLESLKKKDRLRDSRAVSTSPEFDLKIEIVNALYEHGKHLKLSPMSDMKVMDNYGEAIYTMLVNRFPTQLDAAVVEIACDLYLEKSYDMIKYRPKFEVKDPVAWFHNAYKDAIHCWKVRRYRKTLTA